MKNFTYLLLALVLAACGAQATPEPMGGSSSGFAATDSSGSPDGSGQVDPPIRQDSTGEPSTSSGGSGGSSGSSSGSDSSSSSGDRCERFPVDSEDRTYVVCMCDGIVSEPELCPLCKPGTCEPTDCWDGDPGCYCHGWIADPMFCEDGSTG